MANNIPTTAAKAAKELSRSEACCRALVHSAFDLSDKLYDFANWMGDEIFISNLHARPSDDNLNIRQPMIDFRHPIVFADYNGENQCMGIGLKAMGDIDKNEEVFKI